LDTLVKIKSKQFAADFRRCTQIKNRAKDSNKNIQSRALLLFHRRSSAQISGKYFRVLG